MAPTVLVHGSGAIGTIYVYLLSKAGYDVTAVCRSNYDTAKADGFVVDSEIYGEDLHAHPNIVRTPEEAAERGPIDYILVTTKALPEVWTSKVIAPAVTTGRTCIVLLQNGIGIEDEFAEAFPENPLLSCVITLPATQISPGRVRMGSVEGLEIGTFPASAYKGKAHVQQAADTFMEMLQKAGSNAKFCADVQEKRWGKLMLNAPWNPTCALTLSRDVAVLASSAEAPKMMESIMLEVVRVAQALGYTSFTDDLVAEKLKRSPQNRVGYKGIEPSMLVDVLNGRRMEVETILGNPVRVAQKLGVDVPRLELLYMLAKALDESIANRQPGQSLGGDETRAARVHKEETSAL